MRVVERGGYGRTHEYEGRWRTARRGFVGAGSYRIWADTTIRLRHLGPYGYSWEDAGGATPRYDTYYFDVR